MFIQKIPESLNRSNSKNYSNKIQKIILLVFSLKDESKDSLDQDIIEDSESSFEKSFDNKFTNIEVAGTDYFLAERKNMGIPEKKVKEIKEKIQYNEADFSERKENFFNKILDKRSNLLTNDHNHNDEKIAAKLEQTNKIFKLWE